MTTAFVLAGGGSLGAIEVGMLTALTERDIHPDLVVGTSVGAVNGGFFAGRPDADGVAALAEVWNSLSRADVFPICPVTGVLGLLGVTDHLVPNTSLRRLLQRNLPYSLLEEAQVPVHVSAADLLSGADTLLSTGDAVTAILASTAVPGVFPPVLVGDRYFMDGGAVNNAPISHAVQLGAEVVWVLPTGYACALSEPPRSALAIALHALTLVVNARLVLDIERYHDVVELRVVPPLCPLRTSPADFSKSRELIDAAYRQTLEWLEAPAEVGHAH